jgi:phosphocarrier protein HPr
MVEAVFVIKNKLGLHARPAALFVQTAAKFRSEIKVSKGEVEVNGKSVMGLMMLAAECGSKVKVVAAGSDEKKAVDELGQLFHKGFGEE